MRTEQVSRITWVFVFVLGLAVPAWGQLGDQGWVEGTLVDPKDGLGSRRDGNVEEHRDRQHVYNPQR